MSRLLALAATLLTAFVSGCAGDVCSCDLIEDESRCVEFSAPDNPLYATQLSASCASTLSSLCTSLGGTYSFGTACPDADLEADCVAGLASYNETVHWYRTGGDPVDATSTDPEDDCSDTGVVTRY